MILSTSAVTGGNALVGLVAGFLIGLVLAVLAASSRLVAELTMPVVLAASAIPIVALAPVFTIMFGSTTEIARQLVVTVVVIVPVFVSSVRGLRAVAPVHGDLMTSLAATPWQRARFVRLPGAVPYVVTGLRLAAPAAVIAAVVAEYFGGLQNGLGAASPRLPPTPPTRARGPSSWPPSCWGCCSTSAGRSSSGWSPADVPPEPEEIRCTDAP